jgi:hypothetical protein
VSPATELERLRIRYVSVLLWLYFLLVLGLWAMSLTLLIGGTEQQHGEAPFVTGIVMTVFTTPFAVLFSTMFRPLVITTAEVRIPAGFRTATIRTDQVAGIGLLYRRTPNSRAPEGWFLELWDDTARRYQVGRIFRAGLRLPTPPGEKRPLIGLRVNRPADWPLPGEDPGVLANSRPGKIARSVYDFVLRVQGPGGPLAQQELQKHVRADRWAATKTLAWWSPDGQMGRVGNAG